MKIINANKELNKRELYALTRGQSISMKELDDGVELEPSVWLLYSDENSNGSEVEILAIKDAGGTVYTTSSPTFKDEFAYIAELMADEPFNVRVLKRQSKAGRTFITCELC